jgi:hypothetical protein
MLEYTTATMPRKRVTIIPEFIETLAENGSNAQQTIITTASGQVLIVEAAYETVRIHVGQLLGCDLPDEEFEVEEDNDFLAGCNEIG